jgi:hypothetical protein
MSDPAANPIIAPNISTLSAQLKAGKLSPEDRAKPYSGIWPRVPDGLLPFIESPSLEKLAEVLKAHPRLYWHPLVARQMIHLLRLSRDPEEWDVAARHLRALAEAHVNGMRLGKRIGWGALRKKPGPKGGIKNPHPAMPWDEWIDTATLEREFRTLNKLFRVKLKKAGGPFTGLIDEVKGRYRQLVLEVLKDSDIEWTALGYSVPKSEGTKPSASDEVEERSWDRWHDEDIVEPWVSLDGATAEALVEKFMEWKKLPSKEGYPARMAFATLSALLNAKPAQIRNAIENYRRKKKTR